MAFGKAPRDRKRRQSTKPLWFKLWIWTVVSFLGAGTIGFLLLAELRMNPILAVLAGLGVYFFMAFVLGQTLLGPNDVAYEEQEIPQGDQDPRVELILEAHQHVATLSSARSKVPFALITSIDRLHDHAKVIINTVSTQPERLNSALRFFTYYLPSTVDLVEDRLKLASQAGEARLGEIDQTLVRLVEAFAGFEAAVSAPDLESVDLDMQLIDNALDADLDGFKR
jgi:5-bromo-4-chloroindolyl phosphate hydrolysis protein